MHALLSKFPIDLHIFGWMRAMTLAFNMSYSDISPYSSYSLQSYFSK